MIVCEIFFNLKFEKDFFKIKDISEAIKLLIDFSQKSIKMKIEKKTQLVSNTLRLLSQMITTIHMMPNAYQIIESTKAISFIKDALVLHSDCQPCINIDALFCLNNLMNIPEMAENDELCNKEIFDIAYIIYVIYNETAGLDECIITYYYSISKFKKYHGFLKDRSSALFTLMKEHIKYEPDRLKQTCR